MDALDPLIHGKKKRTSVSWSEELIAALQEEGAAHGTDNVSFFSSVLLADAIKRLRAARAEAAKTPKKRP